MTLNDFLVTKVMSAFSCLSVFQFSCTSEGSISSTSAWSMTIYICPVRMTADPQYGAIHVALPCPFVETSLDRFILHSVGCHLSRNGWGVFCEEKTSTLRCLSCFGSSSSIWLDTAGCVYETRRPCLCVTGSRPLPDGLLLFPRISLACVFVLVDSPARGTFPEPLGGLTELLAEVSACVLFATPSMIDDLSV